jgi:DNA-binding transcriptional MocR family regulator
MTRQASTFELILPSQPEGVPSFHWLRNAIRLEILGGSLSPGSRLPASRDLAQQYHLSRGTILAAIDELQAEDISKLAEGPELMSPRSCLNICFNPKERRGNKRTQP